MGFGQFKFERSASALSENIQYTFDRGGRDIVFNVDRRTFRAGAATARCFRDIENQFSHQAALATVAAAVGYQDLARRTWPDVRGPQLKAGEDELLGESLLLAGGVPAAVVERLCRMNSGYRNNRLASFPLAEYGFRPPLNAVESSTEPAEVTVPSRPRRYWRLGTNSTEGDEPRFASMLRGNYVGIGWHKLGNLRTLLDDAEEFRRRMLDEYPTRDVSHVMDTATDFIVRMKHGDIVVAADGKKNLGIARVVGQYEYTSHTTVPNRRRVVWLDPASWPAPVDTGKQVPEGFRSTLTELIDPSTIQAIRRRVRLSSDSLGVPYVEADEAASSNAPEPFTRDPNLIDRATRTHARTQNLLARIVSAHGLEPRCGAGDIPFDLAWNCRDLVCVAEVKSLPSGSEEQQLRLGLGQVLRYTDSLELRGDSVAAILAVERQPSDSRWYEICAKAGVVLAWPDTFETELHSKGLI